MSSEDISKITEAVIEAFKNNPELLKPTAQNISIASDTVTGLLNTALAPIEMLNFVVKEHKEKFMQSYHNKLHKIPESQKIEPKIEITGPIIENLKYKVTEETLRETYAKLLASASDFFYSNEPLLSYNFVLNQISPKEIDVLKYLHNKQDIPVAHIIAQNDNSKGYISLIDNIIVNPFGDLTDKSLSVILSNLIRLGLIQTSYTERILGVSVYEYVQNSPIFKQLKNKIETEKEIEIKYPKLDFRKGILKMTSFGNSFCEIIFK